MTDDLVKRLRNENVAASRTEAADRIETLTAERDKYKDALKRIAKFTQVAPSGEDQPSYEAQIALDALGPTIHAIEAPRAYLKGETP